MPSFRFHVLKAKRPRRTGKKPCGHGISRTDGRVLTAHISSLNESARLPSICIDLYLYQWGKPHTRMDGTGRADVGEDEHVQTGMQVDTSVCHNFVRVSNVIRKKTV